MKKLTTEVFIKKAKEIFGDYYEYENVVYEHSLKKVSITCKKHGDFNIKPSNHINNKQGCPSCGNESTGKLQKKSVNEFLSEVSEKENFQNYDFSLVEDFKNSKEKIKIICSKHGQYERSPRDVLRSKYFGCKKCRIEDDTFDNDEFIKKSNEVHNNKYSYDKIEYVTAHVPVIITCKEHGDFTCKPYIHIAGGGFCPKCTSYCSSYEIEIQNFLKEHGIQIESSVRYKKDIKEIDILSEEQKIAIEFNGLYWHSDLFKVKSYHLDKMVKINNLGYRLINIFEDEWIFKKDLCKSMLLNAFKKTPDKIFARKCSVKEVSYDNSKKFLEENHIQGNCVSKYRYGLFFNDELVSVMTFGKNRLCLNNKRNDGEYELLRFCSKKFTNVVGGASKLFSHFVKNVSPSHITSYCDNRWGTGSLYLNLGFEKTKKTTPNYFYFKGLKRFNRFSFRKNVLVAEGADKNKTEREIMAEKGYLTIHDCGCCKFEMKVKNE